MFVRVKILALSQLTNQVSFASASPWGCMAMGCIHAHTEIPTGTVHRDLAVATVCTGLAPPDGLSPLAWQKQGEVKQHPLGTIRELTPRLGEDVAALATVPKRLQPWQCDTGAGGKETAAPLACTHCSVQDKPLDMGSLGWWGQGQADPAMSLPPCWAPALLPWGDTTPAATPCPHMPPQFSSKQMCRDPATASPSHLIYPISRGFPVPLWAPSATGSAVRVLPGRLLPQEEL